MLHPRESLPPPLNHSTIITVTGNRKEVSELANELGRLLNRIRIPESESPLPEKRTEEVSDVIPLGDDQTPASGRESEIPEKPSEEARKQAEKEQAGRDKKKLRRNLLAGLPMRARKRRR